MVLGGPVASQRISTPGSIREGGIGPFLSPALLNQFYAPGTPNAEIAKHKRVTMFSYSGRVISNLRILVLTPIARN